MTKTKVSGYMINVTHFWLKWMIPVSRYMMLCEPLILSQNLMKQILSKFWHCRKEGGLTNAKNFWWVFYNEILIDNLENINIDIFQNSPIDIFKKVHIDINIHIDIDIFKNDHDDTDRGSVNK